jgi:hypothetical protein
VNTVRSRLFRARMALKESLQPESPKSEEKPRSAVVEIDKAGSSGGIGISKASTAESEA